MRRKFRLNSQQLTDTPSLEFVADTVSVFNSTQNIVLIRAGGNDIPSRPDTSDLWVPPNTAQSYPVQANQFGIGLSSLALAAPVFNKDFPQSCDIIFTAGEIPPSYSAMPIGDIANSALAIGRSDALAFGTGTSTKRWAILPGIRTLSFVSVGDYITAMRVTGVQTGNVYYYVTGRAPGDPWIDHPFFPIETDIDSSYDIAIDYTSLGTFDEGCRYSVLGYQSRHLPQNTTPDGSQVVYPRVPPNFPIYIAQGNSNQPFTVKEQIILPSQTQVISGANMPVAMLGATLGSFLVAATGTYKLRAEIFLANVPMDNRAVYLSHTNNGITVAYYQAWANQSRSVEWAPRSYTINDRIVVSYFNGVAAGGVIGAAVTLYPA